MNVAERIKMVKAMEFIARQVNDEEVFESWLTLGVADEDIIYGDLAYKKEDAIYHLSSYIEDDNFAELMELFLSLMTAAKKSGGLYCDNVVSK